MTQSNAYHSFIDTGPKLESAWRGVVLLGRNVQSYKFALARSLLDLAVQGKSEVGLEELASPFTRYLCEHLRLADKQGTPASSRFLDTCRQFIRGEIDNDSLVQETVRSGFNNVLDAFHTVGNDAVPIEFFKVSGTQARRRVTLTDDVYNLATSSQAGNLSEEIEARWGLVETAWKLGIELRTVAKSVRLDRKTAEIIIQRGPRRTSMARARAALGGYQKGCCFYCSTEIAEAGSLVALAEVDHFIPWSSQQVIFDDAVNLDGVWNLVIACQECNRGTGGKFRNLPNLATLKRLHARNEFYVLSHHPLREAIIAQMGRSPDNRADYLQQVWQTAHDHGLAIWEPPQRAEKAF